MWSYLPVLLVAIPPLALFAGSFTLYQFSRIYINLVWLSRSSPSSSVIWKTARPYVKSLVKSLQAVLGDEEKLLSKVQLTHVLLAAILIVLIVFLERVSTKVRERR